MKKNFNWRYILTKHNVFDSLGAYTIWSSTSKELWLLPVPDNAIQYEVTADIEGGLG